jgi:hypothetical protein
MTRVVTITRQDGTQNTITMNGKTTQIAGAGVVTQKELDDLGLGATGKKGPGLAAIDAEKPGPTLNGKNESTTAISAGDKTSYVSVKDTW